VLQSVLPASSGAGIGENAEPQRNTAGISALLARRFRRE
jgi:hypothetical protein